MPVPNPRKGEEQNDFMGRCMSFMHDEDSNMPQKQMAAACMTQWRKSKEMNNTQLEFYAPIQEMGIQDNKDFFIEGTAITETTTRNNITYVAEELEPAAKTLIGKPILKDHKNEIDSIVGRTTEAGFREKAVKFKAKIMDSKIKEMISDGRITNVSIGAKVKDLVKIKKEKEGSEDRIVAKGLEFLELSLVAVPGDPNAVINHDFAASIAEKFSVYGNDCLIEAEEKIHTCPECEKEFSSEKELNTHVKDKHKMEDEKMSEESIKEIQALKEKVASYEKIEADKRAKEEYEKKVSEEVEKRLQETIKTKAVVKEESHKEDFSNYLIEREGGKILFSKKVN